jgi:hypothetical protein
MIQSRIGGSGPSDRTGRSGTMSIKTFVCASKFRCFYVGLTTSPSLLTSDMMNGSDRALQILTLGKS